MALLEAEVPRIGCDDCASFVVLAAVDSSPTDRITEAGGDGDSSGNSMSSKLGYTNTF